MKALCNLNTLVRSLVIDLRFCEDVFFTDGTSTCGDSVRFLFLLLRIIRNYSSLFSDSRGRVVSSCGDTVLRTWLRMRRLCCQSRIEACTENLFVSAPLWPVNAFSNDPSDALFCLYYRLQLHARSQELQSAIHCFEAERITRNAGLSLLRVSRTNQRTQSMSTVRSDCDSW